MKSPITHRFHRRDDELNDAPGAPIAVLRGDNRFRQPVALRRGRQRVLHPQADQKNADLAAREAVGSVRKDRGDLLERYDQAGGG